MSRAIPPLTRASALAWPGDQPVFFRWVIVALEGQEFRLRFIWGCRTQGAQHTWSKKAEKSSLPFHHMSRGGGGVAWALKWRWSRGLCGRHVARASVRGVLPAYSLRARVRARAISGPRSLSFARLIQPGTTGKRAPRGLALSIPWALAFPERGERYLTPSSRSTVS